MKKLFLFALAAFAVSCSKDAGTNEPQTPDRPSDQPEMVTVSFAVKGDVTIKEDPLSISRAAGVETESKDLYGINIYYDKEKDGKINDVYGYGLFDNVADMTVSLLTGYKYKFVCSLVKDGKSKIYYGRANAGSSISTRDPKGYGMPFWKSTQGFREDTYKYSYDDWYESSTAPTCVENKFVLGTGYHLTGLGQGWGHDSKCSSDYVRKDDCIHYFSADRYYGETTDYIPQKGGVVNISMKRCVFGVKFVITGVTDGTFKFVGKDKKNNIEAQYMSKSVTSDTTCDELLFTYDNVYGCWEAAMKGQEYSEDFTIGMTWTRGNGVIQELDPLTVTFKRNVLTTVNIRLNGGDTDNSFNLDVDNAEMGQESKNFDVDAGDMNDTPIDPTK